MKPELVREYIDELVSRVLGLTDVQARDDFAVLVFGADDERKALLSTWAQSRLDTIDADIVAVEEQAVARADKLRQDKIDLAEVVAVEVPIDAIP